MSIRMLVVCLLSLTIATEAQARRSKREGLNFGTGLRILGSSDRTKATEETEASRSKTSTQTVAPHIGYVVGEIVNLGVQGLFEDETKDEEIRSLDQNTKIDRSTRTSIRGGAFFARFLFADVMFFELGYGLYDRRAQVTSSVTTSGENGSFSGEGDDYTLRSVGTGFHGGGGLEIPIAKGFFGSASYIVRTINFRDHRGDGSLGSNRSVLEKRELLFGLTHYVD